jgi:hypothetical protein
MTTTLFNVINNTFSYQENGVSKTIHIDCGPASIIIDGITIIQGQNMVKIANGKVYCDGVEVNSSLIAKQWWMDKCTIISTIDKNKLSLHQMLNALQ